MYFAVKVRVRVGVRVRVRARVRARLGGGGGILVATPDSVHSTFIELQVSLATTSYPYPS